MGARSACAVGTTIFKAGFKFWQAQRDDRKKAKDDFATARYVLLHSLAHLLITAVSLECGYAASAIRERIYAGAGGSGILLYTAAPGAEGSLGGLVEVGRRLERYLEHALDLGRLCSNDPVCAAHAPDTSMGGSDRHLEGASCHGCLLISEPSCERMNMYLDRSLVVPTVETRMRRSSTVLMAFDDWLDDATPADLEALAQALARRAHSRPFLRRARSSSPVSAKLPFGSSVDSERRTTSAVVWMLRRLAIERRAADDRYANVARLVWSGAADDDEAIRDTRVVLHDLFSRAERHVLISTLVVYNGRTVFAPLERAFAVTQRLVELYVNLRPRPVGTRTNPPTSRLPRHVRAYHWPPDLALP